MQLPYLQLQTGGAAAGVNSIADRLMQAAQMRQQQQQQIVENIFRIGQQRRQDQQAQEQGFQDAYLKAQKLAAAGDLNAAHALLAPYGAQMQQRQAATAMPMQPPAAQPQGEAPSAALESLSDPSAISEQTAAEDAAKPTAWNMLRSADQAQRAQQANAVSFLTGRFNGQDYRLDPEAAREARGQRLDSAFGGSQDAITRELYPQMRPALVASNQELDPTDVFKFIQGEKTSRAAAQRQAEQEDLANRRLVQQAELTDKRLQQSDINNQRMVAALAARGRQGDARLDLATEASARAAAKDVLGAFGFRGELQQFQKFNQMGAQLMQHNAALDAATAGSWVKQAQGGSGVLSDSDMEQFWNRIGSVGERTGEWISKTLTGNSSDPIRQKVEAAVRWLAQQNQTRLREAEQAMTYQFQQSPTISGYTDQMVGTYFPSHRVRVQNKAAAAAGGQVDVSPYRQMLRGGTP